MMVFINPDLTLLVIPNTKSTITPCSHQPTGVVKTAKLYRPYASTGLIDLSHPGIWKTLS